MIKLITFKTISVTEYNVSPNLNSLFYWISYIYEKKVEEYVDCRFIVFIKSFVPCQLEPEWYKIKFCLRLSM